MKKINFIKIKEENLKKFIGKLILIGYNNDDEKCGLEAGILSNISEDEIEIADYCHIYDSNSKPYPINEAYEGGVTLDIDCIEFFAIPPFMQINMWARRSNTELTYGENVINYDSIDKNNLPSSWEEFVKNYQTCIEDSRILVLNDDQFTDEDVYLEMILQLRNYYNTQTDHYNYDSKCNLIVNDNFYLSFKNEDLRDEFNHCFSDLIDKIKNLYDR